MTSAILMCIFYYSPILRAAPLNLDSTFDHTRTGFILIGVHTTLRCEQCHVDAIFKNTRKDCAGCHSVGSRVGATPKPVNHVPTTSPCDTCHVSATSFQVKSFKHIGISSGCAACHNGKSLGVVSKPVNHFPTLLPCENCHTNTNTFSSWKMDHAGITSGCTSCHSGQFASVVSKPATHITTPVGAGCETCHTQANTGNYASFLGAVYDHTGVVAGSCSNCHNGSYPGVVGKPSMHITIPSGATCDTCHTQANTGNYTSFLGAFYDHTAVAAGSCSNCHNGSFPGVLGKPVNHIPTAAACDACHTQSNTNNFLSFKGGAYNHAGAAGTCSTCHTGSYSGAVGKPANHLTTSFQCDTCHTQTASQSYTTWLGALYSHSGATGICSTCHTGAFSGVLGKPATHLPTTAQCDNCHTPTNTNNYSAFLGGIYNHITPTAAGVCSTCHTGSYTNALGKSATHMLTTAQCDTCHTQTLTQNYTTFLGALYNHTGVVAGSCATCHNGVQATGKPVIHITTAQACDQCHTQTNTSNYTTFLGVTNPHKTTTVSGACATCHNGTQAVGQPANHISTGGKTCDVCHTVANTGNFTSFLGAVYDHTGVAAGSCATCHNGSYPGVLGKPTTHVVTTATCDTCHTASNTSNYKTFLGAIYNHGGVVAGSCATCHNGVQAKGKPVVHIPTTLACDQCHTSTNTINFTTFLGAPNPHTVAAFNVGLPSCATCHNGTQALGKPATHVTTAATCDSCHTNTGSYTTWLGAIYSHTGVVAGSCATCHNGIQARGKPATHLVTTASCDSCHTQANTSNYTTFFGAATTHDSTMAGKCANSGCHDGAAATGKSVGHVPVSLSCDSGGCHAMYNGSSVLTFASGTLVHSVVAGSRCDSCHNGSYTSQGVYGAVTKVSNHIPTTIVGSLDCKTCHTGTPPNAKPTSGATAWATGEKMNHNGAQGGGAPVYCVTCHLTGTTYLGNMFKKSHNGASTAKDCSSSGCHKPRGVYGAAYSTWN